MSNNFKKSFGNLSDSGVIYSLGDLIRIDAKQVDPTLPEYSQLPHVNGENIESGVGRLTDIQSAEQDGVTSGKYLFDEGSVLYSKLRPYLRKAAIANFRGVCSADMYPIRCNEELLDRHYLCWLLLSDEFSSYADEESQRSRMPKLNRAQLFAYRTKLPPLPEQNRIAKVLREQMDAVAAAKAAAEKQLQLTESLFRSELGELLQSRSADTRDFRLGEVSNIVRGSSPRPKGDARYYGPGVPRLMVEDLTRDGMYVTPRVDSLTVEGAKLSRPMKKGDVVVVVSGNPGLPAILARDCCIHDGFVGLRNVDESLVRRKFLYHHLNFIKASNDSMATGAIFRNLTTTQLKDMKLQIPSVGEQDLICEQLTEIYRDTNDLIQLARQQLCNIEALPASIVREAFSGRL